MITKPTVLVLGAGASRPYGFPLGKELVDQICATLNSGSYNSDIERRFGERLAALKHDPGHVNDFVNELRRAKPNSLDAFLETRREFREVGKAAIADVLLRAEAASGSLIQNLQTGDWYRYLLNAVLLLRNPEHFKSQARLLTIVTFNFDRSVEWVLFQRVQATFGLTDSAARTLVAELRIFHVHGLLGEPAWLSHSESAGATQYGAAGNEQLITAGRIAVGGIRMVDDEIDRSVVKDVDQVIERAKFVYFVGFGFDGRNLAKLNTPSSVRDAAAVRGTAFEWTALEQKPVTRHFGEPNGIHLYPEADAIGFLRHHAEALFE